MARKPKKPKPGISVDDVVRMAIDDVFPGQTIPDRDNRRADGSQFKAPDHAILDKRVLIERKSRNGEDNSRFLREVTGNRRATGKAVLCCRQAEHGAHH
jgi:hypothetical protein